MVEIANSEEEERQPDAESIRRQKFERRMNRRNAQKSIRQADKLILRGNPELHVKKNMGAQKWRRIENGFVLFRTTLIKFELQPEFLPNLQMPMTSDLTVRISSRKR